MPCSIWHNQVLSKCLPSSLVLSKAMFFAIGFSSLDVIMLPGLVLISRPKSSSHFSHPNHQAVFWCTELLIGP
jgi:hypothetical protein